jgi:hypothetical protein
MLAASTDSEAKFRLGLSPSRDLHIQTIRPLLFASELPTAPLHSEPFLLYFAE